MSVANSCRSNDRTHGHGARPPAVPPAAGQREQEDMICRGGEVGLDAVMVPLNVGMNKGGQRLYLQPATQFCL